MRTWGNGQRSLLTDAHVQEALVPTLDDVSGSELEGERRVALEARVELLAVLEGSTVVNIDSVTRNSLARAFCWNVLGSTTTTTTSSKNKKTTGIRNGKLKKTSR